MGTFSHVNLSIYFSILRLLELPHGRQDDDDDDGNRSVFLII